MHVNVEFLKFRYKERVYKDMKVIRLCIHPGAYIYLKVLRSKCVSQFSIQFWSIDNIFLKYYKEESFLMVKLISNK